MNIISHIQKFKENFFIAINTLLLHKFRSFLTVLGVLIGVFIIITVSASLNGFRRSIIELVEEFGTDNIYISRYPLVNIKRLPSSIRNRPPITLEDAWAIRDLCPSVKGVSPGLEKFVSVVKYKNYIMEGAELRGVFPESEYISNIIFKEGRFFTHSELLHKANVAVLGFNVAQALFPNISGIDKEINLDGKKFRVIGIAQKRKEGPLGSENHEDNVIFIPYYTFKKYYHFKEDHFIAVQAKSGKIDKAIDEITELLRRRRNVKFNEEDNFSIGTVDSIIRSFDQIILAALIVMFILSTVSFIVGGVGVMNIMLVSVTERTKEIGLRKAVGARRKDIIFQFLTEASIITSLGGILGIILGEGGVVILKKTLSYLNALTPMWAYFFGFFGSGLIGLIFGMFPAIKAAYLNPIDALRHE